MSQQSEIDQLNGLYYGSTETGTHVFPAKRGRQGYVVVFHKITSPHYDGDWMWYVEAQNGSIVAESPNTFRSRWDAKRSFARLVHGLGIGNFEYRSED